MSKYYSGKRNIKSLFDPTSVKPFPLSRSKIDLFMNCPRCFYVDRRLGVGQPPGYPFTLNSAVDALLKKEFDIHRVQQTIHPLMKAHGIDAVPFKHEKIEEWRDSLRRGIQFFHEPTNFTIRGGIDDVWISPKGQLYIVDYKATAKRDEVNIDADWQIAYKRQMEIYQWLFRKNNFDVSKIGYFVYANGKIDVESFNDKLEFDIKIIPYEGDDSWVENTLFQAHEILSKNELPESSPECDFCRYRKDAQEVQHTLVKRYPQARRENYL